MNVPYRVRSVTVRYADPHEIRLGLAATATCDVAGAEAFNVQIAKCSDGSIRMLVPTLLDDLQVPPCLRDGAIRREIESRIIAEMARFKAGVESGEVGGFKVRSVIVARTANDLKSQGFPGTAICDIEGHPHPIPLLLIIGHDHKLHVAYSLLFEDFEAPACLRSPTMRAAIKKAIWREIEKWPGAAEATAP